MKDFYSEVGLTPLVRSRINAGTATGETSDPMEELLRMG